MVHSVLELKNKINDLGFQSIGVCPSESLSDEAKKLEQWLSKGFQGEMSYIENHFDFRINPDKLLPGTKSIIVLSFNYFQENQANPTAKISRYAYGNDYHIILRKKSKELESWMKTRYGNILFRAFVDSGPVMERVWAEKAGVSWNGKNTLSIHPKHGSYFFLMCIFTDLEFEYSPAIRNHCGTCTKCIDACPTQAISPSGYILDASKCISYLTIELKTSIPNEFEGKMSDWIFGCDICQEVCPWNRFSKITQESEFITNKALIQLDLDDWLALSEEIWLQYHQKSPLKRSGLANLKRNARFLKKSVGNGQQTSE